MLTDLPGIALAVQTADCLPVFLAHPLGPIATIHAGWRGTLAEITAKAIAVMSQHFSLDPRELCAAIGPSICGACFEIGEEVARSFREGGKAGAWLKPKEKKFLLDLKMANREQMLKAGLKIDKIEIRPECTLCREREYFSYRGAARRGEPNEGRNLSWIARLPGLAAAAPKNLFPS